MFAWCLLDTTRGIAWFCRDRVGVKPLYFYRPRDGGLLFASELRTILAAGQEIVPPIVSRPALESMLAQGAVYGSQSIVRGVEMVGPGESLITDFSGRPVERKTYWTIPSQTYDEHLPREPVVAELARRLRDAVRLRLISDVPLGLFLSGGIDSAAIATVATEVAREAGAEVQSTCIGFDESTFDETDAAAAVAHQLGTRHRSLQLTGQDVLRDLDEVLAAVDQPTVDGFNTYFVARAARRAGLTVALSGVGGDELFGGYASFRDLPRGCMEPAIALDRAGTPTHRLVAALSNRSRRRQGRGDAAPQQICGSTLPASARAVSAGRPASCIRCPMDAKSFADCRLPHSNRSNAQSSGFDPINQVSRLELCGYMRHMLLRDADVFSMANALEVRVPLLDHELLELAARCPGAWKRADPRPKPLLVDAVGPRLPRTVYAAPKRGFSFPWGAWLRDALRNRAAAAIDDRDSWASLRLNADACTRCGNDFSPATHAFHRCRCWRLSWFTISRLDTTSEASDTPCKSFTSIRLACSAAANAACLTCSLP